MKRMLFVAAILLSPLSLAGLSDIQVKGFGSVILGTVVDGDGFIANYPDLGIYDDKFDFGEETRVGIQTNASLSERATATIQLVGKSANDFEPVIDWMFLRYNLTNDLDLQAGRMRMPVYKYSEFMDVGYAYPWIRIPSDTYSLDVVNYNGARLNYLTGSDDIPLRLSLFVGNEESKDRSELMSYLFDFCACDGVHRRFDNIIGTVIEVNFFEFADLRVSYTESDMEERWDEALISEDDISFIDIYMGFHFGPVELFLEYNEYDPFYESYFISTTYRINKFTYYLSWSEFVLDAESDGTAIEQHDTTSIGLRYELDTKIALKFDISDFKDTGAFPVYKANEDGKGDATILSVGLDFVF